MLKLRSASAGVLGGGAALRDAGEVGHHLLRAKAEGAGLPRGEQPALEEVAHEELVAGHVPEEEGLPLLEVAAALREHDQRAIAALRIEATVQDLGDVAEPLVARRADGVLLAEAIEVLALREGEVPGREDGVRLFDHRALHDGERRSDVRTGTIAGRRARRAPGRAGRGRG
jgi:hypothetical protein